MTEYRNFVSLPKLMIIVWKILKGQKSSPQMSAFVDRGKHLAGENYVYNMWDDHFEALGTPSASTSIDDEFAI